MKAKVSRGSGFRGALSYLLDAGPKATGEKKAEIVGGNMAGRTIYELSREFGNTRALRPDIKKPVWHASLSLPAGETLNSEGWGDVSSAFLKEMGFSDRTPFTVIRHSDTDYDHVHILLSRTDLDASVWHGKWEARTAINATQKLEKDFGLRLTPGLGSARAERKRETAEEINQSFRTKNPAPRLVIQKAIDDLLAGEPISALEFAERLEGVGIGVRANLASTGRMNGFSFEYGGVPFKASQLGKAYGWKRLQERGVTYEQNRDSAGLERFRAAKPANPANPSAPGADGAESHRDRGTTPSDSGASQPSPGATPGLESDGDRAAGTGAAHDAGRHESGNDQPGDDEIREIDAAIADDDPENIGRTGEQHRELGGGSHSGHDAKGAGASGTPEVVENARTGDGQRDSERRGRGRGDWASRFKTASAARRGRPQTETSDRENNARRASVATGDLQAARTIDPTHYLENAGFRVRWEGRHASVRDERGDEHYRLTQQRDGRVLWCDLYGQDGGDSIALVRDLEPELPFSEAVFRLLGGTGSTPAPTPQQWQTPRPPQYPTMPLGSADAVEAGRSYLRDMRMIDDASIGYAEQSKMLRYDPQGGLLFAGYDDTGRARNVTQRATNPRAKVQKRDLRGSDKAFPPILPGDRGAPVWIVEGGTDAIALHAEARAAGKQIPQIIVSGGSGVRSFLENRQVQQLLRDAPKVTIAADNEKDAEVQRRTDAQHDAQREAVATFNPEVRVWHPPEGYGDVSDMRVSRELDRREAAELAAAEARAGVRRTENHETVEWNEKPEEAPEPPRPSEPDTPSM